MTHHVDLPASQSLTGIMKADQTGTAASINCHAWAIDIKEVGNAI